MNAIARNLRCLFRDEAGATAIEYGLIAAGMGLALMTIMFNFSAVVAAGYAMIAGLFDQVAAP